MQIDTFYNSKIIGGNIHIKDEIEKKNSRAKEVILVNCFSQYKLIISTLVMKVGLKQKVNWETILHRFLMFLLVFWVEVLSSFFPRIFVKQAVLEDGDSVYCSL